MFEKLKPFVCQYVEIEESEIKPSSRFADDLGFNSYDFISMLGDAEDEFEIEIDESVAGSLKTLGELAEYFEELSK
ncbi:MAG: acyl carrier protein [Oscillospiraceae bacterium]|nr:acyl carrier protein [Oscillospiraceae bacterium]MDE6776489.1 acyl carrier protein [Oscillospiraceae bacterium]